MQVQQQFKTRTSSGGMLVNDTLMHLRSLTTIIALLTSCSVLSSFPSEG